MPENNISIHKVLSFVLLNLGMCVYPKIMEESVVRGSVRQKMVLTILYGNY